MFVSLASLGSMILDVVGNRMDATFLDQTGTVRDTFTIEKTPDSEPPLLTRATAPDDTLFEVTQVDHRRTTVAKRV